MEELEKTEPTGEIQEVLHEKVSEETRDAIWQEALASREAKLLYSKYERSEKRFWFFILGMIVALVIMLVALFIMQKVQENKYDPSKTDKTTSGQILETNSEEIMQKLQMIQSLIDTYFLYDVDAETVVNSLYSALLDSLGDPYSVYYTPKEYAELMESGAGIYYGIGVSVMQDVETMAISVITVFEDTPAEEAGLLPGDVLVRVGDKSVADVDINTVVTWIKGEENSTVDITIARDGEEHTFMVARKKIDIPSVESTMLEDSIGYLAISEFNETTTAQFISELEELDGDGMESLIIDLRGNPGGYLDTTVDMLDYLLPEGMLVYMEDKYGNRTEYKSDKAAEYKDVPIVILVDGNSASASEVFSGAMQDYERATIVGAQTYGKGIVQSVLELGDGSGIKLTVSDYYTPNGNNIHGVGITPDVVVELDEELLNQVTITFEEDNQLQKAIEVLQTQKELKR
ncbi:MAG: S41 family peptidase [Lachnospiraceae bacterium]|nr:S41 family peptidase [Lachnospiraceae bacterium]